MLFLVLLLVLGFLWLNDMSMGPLLAFIILYAAYRVVPQALTLCIAGFVTYFAYFLYPEFRIFYFTVIPVALLVFVAYRYRGILNS